MHMQIEETGAGAAGGRVAALVVAGGRSERYGYPKKQFALVAGAPLVVHTLKALETSPLIDCLVLVVPPSEMDSVRRGIIPAFGFRKEIRVAAGGDERQDSVAGGLSALPADVEWVLVHDGVRPLVTSALIERVLKGAFKSGAAIPGIPVSDTIKLVDDAGVVRKTIERRGLWRIQTPQAFRKGLLVDAYKAGEKSGLRVTDDAGMVESMGVQVAVVDGDETNIKVTTPGDMRIVENLILSRPAAAPSARHRVGIGYDVHRLVKGDGVWLGGVFIPCDTALSGHSDADVLCHAIMDAILGACGDRDIGHHFPSDDPYYEGSSSIQLLAKVAGMAASKGFTVGNIDTVVVAEKPKIGPYVTEMKRRIAAAAGTGEDYIGVKATTSEGIGFAGRGEGVCAWATVRLEMIGGAQT